MGRPPGPARFSHTWIENRFPKFQAHDPEVKFMFIQHLLHLAIILRTEQKNIPKFFMSKAT